MPSGTLSFTADVNKIINVTGEQYTLTIPTLPAGVEITLNETVLESNTPVTLTENAVLGVNLTIEPGFVTVNYTGVNSVTYDGDNVDTTERLEIVGGEHNLNIVGATSIPEVELNGAGITHFSINGNEFDSGTLPYTFTPMGGIRNQIFVSGEDAGEHNISIVGQNIEGMTVNGAEVTLPYKTTVTEPLDIAVSGRVYQVDLTSSGGAKISNGDINISDGTSSIHQIIDITEDTYLTIDGTHTVTVNGTNIKSISLNGVQYPVTALPVNIQNKAITATFYVNGYEPSEVHVVGDYIKTVTVDGTNIPINENGSVDFELTTVEENHFINIEGAQPRKYGITVNDNGATEISMNGKKLINGTKTLVDEDVYISAVANPIPIHIESAQDASVQVNGRRYNTTDFTVEVQYATEIDVTTDSCQLTIDYGDDSTTLLVPATTILLTAPHRDGWIFDGWSSSDVGIISPKMVKTSINLTGISSANLVCHYQRFLTCNKPNSWN